MVDAVACAVAIQKAMGTYNAGIHVDRQIILRIGINVGDIIIDGNDIFGDGVNVAARLEALCEPGGVCISRSANEQIRDKLSIAFADLGEQTVKNIARAVGVYGLAAKDIAALPDEAVPPPNGAPVRVPWQINWRMVLAGCAVLLLLMLVGVGWSLVRRPQMAAYSPEDRRKSLIVLPFANSSGDPAQDALANQFHPRCDSQCHCRLRRPACQSCQKATAGMYRGKAYDLHAIRRDHNVHFAGRQRAAGQSASSGSSRPRCSTIPTTSPVWTHGYTKDDTQVEHDLMFYAIIDGFDQSSTDAELAMHGVLDRTIDKRDCCLPPIRRRSTVGQDHLLKRLEWVNRALALDPDTAPHSGSKR